MKKHLLFFTLAFFLTGFRIHAEIVLVKNGEACAEIIRLPGISAPALFAGLELRDHVEKMTGAVLPRIRKPGDAPYKIYIVPPDQKDMVLPAKARALLDKVEHDGFVLYTEKNVLYVAAKHIRGLNYGVYELLKRFGGIRWIVPGPEGEFIPKKRDFIIPDLAEVVNPSFKHRDFNLVSAYGSKLTPQWQMRNGMTQYGAMFGGRKNLGGHVFSALLPDTLFREHPELFCYYKGERHPQVGDPSKITETSRGMENQPCTSNPETVRIMCENLVRMLKDNPEADSFCILNNDSTQWCECEACRKLDPPEEAARGLVSTRFWLLANALIEAGKKAAPDVVFFASPYQSFQEYPAGVEPDPRAEINFCLHHRCYLHSIGDPKCIINERYRGILRRWHREKRNVRTYEYTNILPRGEVWYLPTARLLKEDLRWYHALGNDGWCDEVAPFDGTFVSHDTRQETERWIGSALDLYLTAQLLWNVDLDFDAAEDEAGSLYYGKAWPAMKEYRKLLFEAYRNINDHFCYGSKLWQLGRFAEYPGIRKALGEKLERAKELAKGDPRVEKIVARDAEFFALTFEKSVQDFASHVRNDVHAGKYTAEDPDWTLSDWTSAGTVPVKVAWTPSALYLRIFPCGEILPGDQLEIVPGGGKTFTVPAAAGEIHEIPLAKEAVEGESMDLGIVLIRGGKRVSWNGKAEKAPGIFRKVQFGNDPLFRNGSFESTVSGKDGNAVPADMGTKGSMRVVSDGTAASGEAYLRGKGMVFEYLNGLRGHTQAYVVYKKYRGKLRVRVQFRGQGRASVQLHTEKHCLIGDLGETVDSDDWQDREFVFDCSGTDDSLLILYVNSHSDTLDWDDIRVEKITE